MRRPQATTVSAPSTKASGWRAATARAFAAARRSAWRAGSSCASGRSSISAGSTLSGLKRDLGEEIETPRRGRCQHQALVRQGPDRRYLKRKVMRPLLRS